MEDHFLFGPEHFGQELIGFLGTGRIVDIEVHVHEYKDFT
jgi:hypothetical protein